MEYNIVPMDRSHIEQIAALERECFSTPWSEAMLTEVLFDSQASFIVAESEDGGVLGYAGLQVVLDEGYIDNIAVEPNARRHGVADELLDVFCRFGEANLAFLTLEVRASNAPAIALYRKHGFEEAGRLAAYYSKGRTAPKVEIDYIQKKHVKKPGGAKPGFVVYYTNYSLMAAPDISGIKEAQ